MLIIIINYSIKNNKIRFVSNIQLYKYYLQKKSDINGVKYQIIDKSMKSIDKMLFNVNDPMQFLDISAFKAVLLKSSPKFVDDYIV